MKNNPYLEDDFSIKNLLGVLVRHKNLILLTSIIAIIISFYYTFTISPIYKASTSIMIKDSNNGASSVLDFTGSKKITEIENEKLLIMSRIVAENALSKLWQSELVNNLHILGTKNFIPKFQDERKLLRKIFTLGMYKEKNKEKLVHSEYFTVDSLRPYAKSLQKNLSIQNELNSDILVITFSSPFAREAAIVSNAIAESYIEIDKKWASNQASAILNFVSEQADNIEQKLSIAEEKLKSFKENEGVFDFSGNYELILTRLVDSESKYLNTVAESNILEEKKRYKTAKLSEEEKTLAVKLSNSINSTLFALRNQISQKESELIKNSTLHGEKHEAIIDLKNDIKALKEKLDKEAKTLIEQGIVVADPVKYRQEIIEELLVIDSELTGLNATADEYDKLVKRYEKELNSLPSLQLSFASLERDRSVLNQTYMFMRQKVEESRIQVASKSGKIQIIDEAVIPSKKSSPNHKKNLLTGLFLGFIIGFFLSLLIEYFDTTIKSIDDIFSELTILGIIPAISDTHKSHHSHHSTRFSFKYFKRRFLYYKNLFFTNNTSEGNLTKNIVRHLITHEEPKSPISEAYRSLRTSISYSNSKHFKSMVVSSAGPGEGKTTSIANLAITYANLGKKVLLIDTDLRRPVINKIFIDEKNKEGITSYLTGAVKDISEIITKTEISNLYVIPSGIIPPNPSELLESDKMAGLLSKLEDDWDIILFDSPPLFAVTDASLIAKHTDKLMLVVMPGKTDKNAFNHCVDNLNNMNLPIDGVVLNGVNTKNSYGSYYYYYQYYNYYGQSKK